MNGYRVNGLWDQRHHEHNARVTNAHVNAEHYVRDIPGAGIYANTTTGASKTNINSLEVARLPDSGSPYVSFQVIRPAFWLDGIVTLQILYSHSASSQAAVVDMVAGAARAGSEAANISDISEALTFPASTANQLEWLDASVGLPVDGSHDLLGWKLTRDSANGSDGTAVLRISGVRLTYIPRRQEI